MKDSAILAWNNGGFPDEAERSGRPVRPDLTACGDGRLLVDLERLTRGRANGPRPALGFDVRPEAVEQTRSRGFEAHCCDWLTGDAARRLPADVDEDLEPERLALVTNPPFCLGLEFARTCLERAPGGLVALLLRLTWLEPTADRGDWLAANPADVWIPPTRGRFANGSTDSATAAWFVWPPEDDCGPGHRVRYLGRH